MSSEHTTKNNAVNKDNLDLLKDGIYYTGNKGPAIGARHIQVVISAISLGIALATRITFSVAIIAMTDNSTSSNENVPTYDWDNKSIILSAVFWGALCFPLISGHLGKQYGPKWFIFGASLLDALAFILIPVAAKYGGSVGVMICRIIEGLAQGIILPVNTCVLGNWVPTEERSKMGFIGTLAISFLVMIVSSATGYISASSLGWPGIFYIFGALGLLWCAVFGFLAQQSPATHPRITPEERKYIQVSLGQRVEKAMPTPWIKIFTSIHVWAILIAQIGTGWVLMILQTEMSIFMTKVMQYSVKSYGVISAIMPLCGIASGIVVSFLSDYLPKKNFISLLNSRRLFHTIGHIGLSTCFLFMTFVPVKYATWAVVLMFFGYAFVMGVGVGGSDINTLDVSPKYAGIIFGCYTTISQSISLVAPILVQLMVTDETDATQWRTTFIISAVISIVTTIFFDVFASATCQNWDGEDEKEAKITTAKRRTSILSITGPVLS